MKRTLTSVLFLFLFMFITSQVDAQQQERLKSVVALFGPSDSLLTPEDSTVYFYSGARSVDSFFLLQEYDSSFIYSYTAGTGYAPHQLYRATYDADNNILTDTIYQYDTLTGTYDYWQLYLYNYINTRFPYKVFTFGYSNNAWDTTGGTEIREYNNAGQITVELSLNRTDTVGANYFSYTPAGLYRTIQYYNYPFGTHYAYWYSYTYDSLGREDTSLTYYRPNDTAAWKPQQIIIDYYDSTGYMSYALAYNADSSGWKLSYRTLATYDNNHNPTQYIFQGMDSSGQWINQSRNFFTYDSYSMRTTVAYGNNWDTTGGGSWGSEPDIYYLHYELYDLPTGIATTSAQAELRIYPVPAADMLSLDVKWQEPQSATAMIFDASGRKYTEWPLPNALTYHGYVPVSMMPAGTYILQIKGSCGSISRSFDVMR